MGLPRLSIACPLLLFLLVGTGRMEAAPPAVAHANVLLDVSGAYVDAGLAQTKSQVMPIRRMSQGTLITGTYFTTFHTSARLVPDESHWVFDVLVNGSGQGCAAASRERMELHGRFRTPFQGCKRLCFDGNVLGEQPALAQAGSCIRLLDVDVDVRGPIRQRIGERLVGRVFERRKPEYEANVARVVKSRLEEAFDRAAAEKVDEANRNYRDNLRLPLERQGLFPSELALRTTPTHLHARALLTGANAPPTLPPPALAEGFDVGLRLHESFANNAVRFFADRTVRYGDLDRQLEWLAGPVRKVPPTVRNWSMTYAHKQPMQVTFADHRIQVVMRASKFTADDTTYPGLNIVVRYRLMPTGEGIQAIREGEVEVLPPPGQTFGARERIVAALVKQRLERLYRPVLVAKRPRTPPQLGQAGPMRPMQADAANGWLILAWKRTARP